MPEAFFIVKQKPNHKDKKKEWQSEAVNQAVCSQIQVMYARLGSQSPLVFLE